MNYFPCPASFLEERVIYLCDRAGKLSSQQGAHVSTDGVGRHPSVHRLSAAIPEHDGVIHVSHDDRVGCQIE
jgi:hypothetical protein